MPAYTPILGLYKPGGGSTGLITPDEPVDIDKINGNFDLVDANIGTGSWATTGRPISPTVGRTGYNSTLDVLERWNGSTWVSIVPGYLKQSTLDTRYSTPRAFQRLFPTVTGGSVLADGTATVSGGASSPSPLIASGIVDFSKFLRYQLHWSANSFSSPGTGVYIRGTIGGTPDGSHTYDTQNYLSTGSTITAHSIVADAQGQICSGNNETSSASASGVIDIVKVSSSARMQMRFRSNRTNPNQLDTSGTIDYYTASWTNFDGFAIFVGTGTATLNFVVYAH